MFLPRWFFFGLLFTTWAIGFFLPVLGSETLFAALLELEPGGEPEGWISVITWTTALGFLAGFLFFGFLADLIGRFRLLVWLLIYASVFSLIGAMAWSGPVFALARFFLAAACSGLFLTGTLLAFENRSNRDRLLLASLLPTTLFLGVAAGWILEVALPPKNESWRSLLMIKGLPGLFALFFRKYHDEPRAWKVAVRDVTDDKPFSRPLRRLRGFQPRKGWGTGFLLTGILLAGLAGLERWSERNLATLVRQELFPQYIHDGELGKDALVLAYLVRYPELLGVVGSPAWHVAAPLGGKLLAPMEIDRSLPSLIFAGLLELHAASKPVRADTLAEEVAVAWHKKTGADYSATEIPLDQLEATRRQVRHYLNLAEKFAANDPRFVENAYMAGPDRWRLRKDRFEILVEDLDRRYENRNRREFHRADMYRLCFFLGVLPGAILLYLFATKTGKSGAAGLFFLLAAGAVGFLVFGREFIEFRLFLAGAGILPLLAVPILLLPKCFPASARGTGIGLAVFLAGIPAFIVAPFLSPQLLPIVLLSGSVLSCINCPTGKAEPRRR